MALLATFIRFRVFDNFDVTEVFLDLIPMTDKKCFN